MNLGGVSSSEESIVYLFNLLLLFSATVFVAEKSINDAKGMYIAGASELLNDADIINIENLI